MRPFAGTFKPKAASRAQEEAMPWGAYKDKPRKSAGWSAAHQQGGYALVEEPQSRETSPLRIWHQQQHCLVLRF